MRGGRRTVVGAGGFGAVFRNKETDPGHVTKLLYDLEACNNLQHEARIQTFCRETLLQQKPVVPISVPEVFRVWNETQRLDGVTYLCGIEMEYLPPPSGYRAQVHILLSEKASGDELDREVGRSSAQPVNATNPPRGFYASPGTMEEIWSDEGSSMTIEKMAWLMGRGNRLLLDAGVIPADIEWVWSGGRLWIIDFGLCRFGTVAPEVFLRQNTVEGLGSDIYHPREGERGFREFLDGFLGG